MTSSSDPVLELKELQEYFAGRLPERLAGERFYEPGPHGHEVRDQPLP